MNRIIRYSVTAGLLALSAGLGGCYATMARLSPEIQGHLVNHGRPVSDAQVFIARDEDAGRCGEVPKDAQAPSRGVFKLEETRQPEWVYPNPRYASWTLCIAYQGHTYVGFSMAQLDYPPAQLSLRCDLSQPQRQQAEHSASVYGFCQRT